MPHKSTLNSFPWSLPSCRSRESIFSFNILPCSLYFYHYFLKLLESSNALSFEPFKDYVKAYLILSSLQFSLSFYLCSGIRSPHAPTHNQPQHVRHSVWHWSGWLKAQNPHVFKQHSKLELSTIVLKHPFSGWAMMTSGTAAGGCWSFSSLTKLSILWHSSYCFLCFYPSHINEKNELYRYDQSICAPLSVSKTLGQFLQAIA